MIKLQKIKNMTKLQKIINTIAYTILACMVIAIIWLSVSCSKKSATIKDARMKEKQYEIVIDSLQKRINALGDMDAIRCDVTFQMRNVNTLGIQKVNAQQVANQVATYTRKELLDSIYKNVQKKGNKE